MGIDFTKHNVSEDMRETINMVKGISMEKGVNPDRDKAQVVAIYDLSSSTEHGENKLWSDGTMEATNRLASAVGFTFDDDGEIPNALFHNSVIDLGNLTPSNYEGFITEAYQNNRMGGTEYLPALRWIVETVGLNGINLGPMGLYGDQLSVKYTAPMAVYAYFVTDGEPLDSQEAICQYLRLMSQLPIFVQFIGVGNHNFSFLKKVNDLDGTLVDNCGFFDMKDVLGGNKLIKPSGRRGLFGGRQESKLEVDDAMKERMLRNMLGEFPSYYSKARRIGLVSN